MGGNLYLVFLKPLIDFLGAVVLLVICLPLFTIIGIMIKLDSKGPIFFRQRRIGKNMQYFNIYKFRTMVVNNQTDQYTTSNDPRITKLGSFLRKSSLDELPQFINVLIGDMSMIGPRPSIEREIADYGLAKFKRRVVLKPGITGLHQSTLRSKATLRQKLLLDAYYCRKCSFLLDMQIIFLTFKTVLFKPSTAN